jgi:hypothetical protein
LLQGYLTLFSLANHDWIIIRKLLIGVEARQVLSSIDCPLAILILFLLIPLWLSWPNSLSEITLHDPLSILEDLCVIWHHNKLFGESSGCSN